MANMKIMMAGTRGYEGDSNSLGDDHVYQLCFEVPARGVICQDISQGHPDDFVRENITTIDKDDTHLKQPLHTSYRTINTLTIKAKFLKKVLKITNLF